jgi:predicted O-methyltransferase YrrM
MMTAETIRKPYKMHGAKEMLRELRSEADPTSQSLAKAVEHFLNHSVSPEEEEYIDRVESLRKKLSSSTEQITVVDYGAVSSEVTVPSGETAQGITVQRTVGQTCKAGSVPPMWGLLLFKLIREFKPISGLELGTSLGISTAYQTSAMEMNGSGKFVSLEGSPALANLARTNLKALGLKRATVKTGPFQDTVADALEESRPIDYALIDGHHEEHATLRYFEQIFPFLADNSVIVFDDVSWSAGMRRAWNRIIADSRVQISVDLSKLGICVMTGSRRRKQSFKCHLSYWQKALVRMGVTTSAC